MTYRQYKTWQAWLDLQWDNPDRHDLYLMQIACEVRRVLSDKPNQIKLDHFHLRFKSPAPKKRPHTPQSIAAAKSLWLSRVGMAPDVTNGPAKEGA